MWNIVFFCLFLIQFLYFHIISFFLSNDTISTCSNRKWKENSHIDSMNFDFISIHRQFEIKLIFIQEIYTIVNLLLMSINQTHIFPSTYGTVCVLNSIHHLFCTSRNRLTFKRIQKLNCVIFVRIYEPLN